MIRCVMQPDDECSTALPCARCPLVRCESCGELADLRLDDGSYWCISCDIAARNLGIDNRPARLL